MITTLVVEDSIVFRQALKETLWSFFPDMEIKEASDWEQTLKVVRDYAPELVFMDIRLPKEDGLALTRIIKNMIPETTVVILTNYDSKEYLEAAATSGASCFAIKGTLQQAHLEILVNEVLNKSARS